MKKKKKNFFVAKQLRLGQETPRWGINNKKRQKSYAIAHVIPLLPVIVILIFLFLVLVFFFYFSLRLKVIILRYIYTLYVYVIQCGVPALAAPDPAARWA